MLDHGKGRRVLIMHRKPRGVSLIEIMIGLVIVALLFAFGLPSFATFMQNTHVRSAAEAMQNGLSLAKAEAVRRNTYVQFVLGTGSSWTVRCTNVVADSDSDGVAECPDNIQARSPSEGSSNAAVSTTPTTATTVEFNGYGRTTAASVFDITNPTAGTCVADGGRVRCLRVTVSAAGQIRMCDPALTISRPSDPQAC